MHSMFRKNKSGTVNSSTSNASSSTVPASRRGLGISSMGSKSNNNQGGSDSSVLTSSPGKKENHVQKIQPKTDLHISPPELPSPQLSISTTVSSDGYSPAAPPTPSFSSSSGNDLGSPFLVEPTSPKKSFQFHSAHGHNFKEEKGKEHSSKHSHSLSFELPSLPSIGNGLDVLSTLTYLDLSTSANCMNVVQTTGRLPRWIQKCTSLQYLVGKNVGLTVLDEWVGQKLVNLKVIRLPNNKIATWPSHLARLLPYSQLAVIDLEGNPCLENLFRKSPSFAKMYHAADELQSSDDTSTLADVKSVKDSGTAVIVPAARKSSKNKKYTTSGSSIAVVVENKIVSSPETGWKISKKKKEEPETVEEVEEEEEEEESDDDMLTSLAPSSCPPPLLKNNEPASPVLAKYQKTISSTPLMNTPQSFSTPQSATPQSDSSVKSTPPTPASSYTPSDRNISVSLGNESSYIGRAGRGSTYSVATSVVPSTPRDLVNLPINLADKWANQRVEQSELEKSKIVLRILQDIHEISAGEAISPLLVSSPTTSVKLSAGYSRLSTNSHGSSDSERSRHTRLNSIDIINSYLEGGSNADSCVYRNKKSSEPTTPTYEIPISLSSPLETSTLILHLETFMSREIEFISQMSKFCKLMNSKSKYRKKLQPLLGNLPEIYHLHAETTKKVFSSALQKVKKDQDQNLVALAHHVNTMLGTIRQAYYQYALEVQESVRQAKFWMNLPPPSNHSQTTLASSELALFTPSSVPTLHPDGELGQWLRECTRKKHKDVPSVIDYMVLPFERIDEWHSFFEKLSIHYPVLHQTSNSINEMIEETNRRKPLRSLRRRREELESHFGLTNDAYGDLICDASVTLQRQIVLEDVTMGSKNKDVIYSVTTELPDGTPRTETTAKSLKVSVFQTRNMRNTTVRFLVFKRRLLIADDSRRQIIQEFDKNDVSASSPWYMRVVSSNADDSTVNDASTAGTGSCRAMSVMTSDSTSSNWRDSNSRHQVRLVFKKNLEIWYCGVRSYYNAQPSASSADSRLSFIQSLSP